MQDTLIVGTGGGVFEIRKNGGDAQTRYLGLEDKGNVRWILSDAEDSARVWAATERAGVWRSDDGGKTWCEKNEGLVYKHTLSLARHPKTGTLYVGTEPACIFRSDDLGDTWVELEAVRKLRTRKEWTFPGPPHVAHIRGIGLDPADPDLIFGAVEEGWLIRSTDGGDTWDNIIDGTEFDSHTVTILPGGSGVIVSASGTGLYRSADGGLNFAKCDTGIDHPYLINVAVHPDRPNVLFTAGAKVPPPKWGQPGGPGGAFYRSDDAGLSWNMLTNGLPDRIGPAPRSIAIDPKNPEKVYIGLNDGQIWATENGGNEFSLLTENLPPVIGISPVSSA
ncbi:MAG: WD40/YVTN/BNR-like repeat-containing protein [Alphaproteobacteria bacterium]